MPKISVIVPAYNVGRFIRHCVDSILAQDFDDFEVIVVNDGSTDDTLSILESYQDQRLKIHTKPNGGLTAARNTGLSLAQGDYVMHIDGDDYVEPDLLSKTYRCAQLMQADMVITDRILEFSNRTIFEQCCRISPLGVNDFIDNDCIVYGVVDKAEYLNLICRCKTFSSVWSILFSKELAKQIVFPEHIFYAEDLYTVILYIDKAVKIARVHKAFYHYRAGGLGINASDVFRSKHIKDFLWVIKTLQNTCFNSEQMNRLKRYLWYQVFNIVYLRLLSLQYPTSLLVSNKDYQEILTLFRESLQEFIADSGAISLVKKMKYRMALRYLSTKKDNESLLKGIRLVQNILYFGRKKRKLQPLHLDEPQLEIRS